MFVGRNYEVFTAMKLIALALFCGVVFCQPFNKVSVSKTDPPPSPTLRADSIDFAAQIEPILKARCNPCHFPGGKMYAQMPFDQAKTVLDHSAGMMRRLNAGKDGSLLKRFIVSRLPSK